MNFFSLYPFSAQTIFGHIGHLGPSLFGPNLTSAQLNLANHNWPLLALDNLTLAIDTWAPLFLDQISFWFISLGPKSYFGPSHFGMRTTEPGDVLALGLLGLVTFGTG